MSRESARTICERGQPIQRVIRSRLTIKPENKVTFARPLRPKHVLPPLVIPQFTPELGPWIVHWPRIGKVAHPDRICTIQRAHGVAERRSPVAGVTKSEAGTATLFRSMAFVDPGFGGLTQVLGI